jgi:hypothetical protein
MRNVDAGEGFDLGEIEAEGLERTLELAFRAVGDLCPGLGAAHVKIGVIGMLRTPAVHLDFNMAGKLAAQVVDMDAGSSINMGWVFACK